LGDYDMVLGVQWLGTLGPVLWDFARHKLCFTRSGKRITWTGIDTTPGLASVPDEPRRRPPRRPAGGVRLPLRRAPRPTPRSDTSATAFASSPAREPSPFAPIATPTPRRTSSSASVMRCCAWASSGVAPRRSHPRHC
jgi:hypothetical protein